MYRVTLINMPFAALDAPSLALTQLRSILRKDYAGRVSVEILYLNQDFARWFGLGATRFIETSADSRNSGLGEWLFRLCAFPELADNEEDYLGRYFFRPGDHTELLRSSILPKRAELDAMLDGLIDAHGIHEAQLVGFTSMFSQNNASFALARRLKDRRPDLLTVMGGANCESPMGEEIVTNVPAIDFVFSGAALKSFPEFVGYCLDDERRSCHLVKGVLSKENCGAGALDAAGRIGDDVDIDAQIELDYESFLNTFEDRFAEDGMRPTLYFETSRGCRWGERVQCTFCGLNGTTLKYRSMSPERALQQFEAVFQYADRCREFQAVDNVMPRNFVRDVFPVLETPAGASIFYEVRTDLSEAELQVLSRAGVKRVQPGIESLSTKTLKLMRKGTSAFQNLAFLKACLAADVKPDWNLLIGFPGEPEEVYEKYVRDLSLLTHLPPPTGVHPVRFDRYSPYFVRAEEFGLELHPYDFYGLVYPLKDSALERIAYYFMDYDVEADYLPALVRWIGKVTAQVDEWRARWEGNDGTAPARLFLTTMEGRSSVYDSRSGVVTVHELEPVWRQVLDQLEVRTARTALPSRLKSVAPAEVGGAVECLSERGLVFEERAHLLSLVAREEPSVSFRESETMARDGSRQGSERGGE